MLLKLIFLRKHVKDNLALYIVVSVSFLIGISIGAFTINELNIHQEKGLISYLRGFFRFLGNSGANSFDVIRQ